MVSRAVSPLALGHPSGHPSARMTEPIDQMRRKYYRGPLTRDELDDDPIVQFERWFDEALDRVKDAEPNAYCALQQRAENGDQHHDAEDNGRSQDGDS